MKDIALVFVEGLLTEDQRKNEDELDFGIVCSNDQDIHQTRLKIPELEGANLSKVMRLGL